MKRIPFIVLCLSLLTASLLGQAAAPAYSGLKVGDVAPDFTLSDSTGKAVKLSEFRGKNNVVLAFYVFAFTGG